MDWVVYLRTARAIAPEGSGGGVAISAVAREHLVSIGSGFITASIATTATGLGGVTMFSTRQIPGKIRSRVLLLTALLVVLRHTSRGCSERERTIHRRGRVKRIMFRFIVIVVGGGGEVAALLRIERPTRTLTRGVALVAATALHHSVKHRAKLKKKN